MPSFALSSRHTTPASSAASSFACGALDQEDLEGRMWDRGWGNAFAGGRRLSVMRGAQDDRDCGAGRLAFICLGATGIPPQIGCEETEHRMRVENGH